MKMEFEFERHHECIRNAHKFTFRSHKTSMSNFRCLGSEYILSNFVSGRQTNFRCNSMMHFDLTIHLVLENYGVPPETKFRGPPHLDDPCTSLSFRDWLSIIFEISRFLEALASLEFNICMKIQVEMHENFEFRDFFQGFDTPR